MLKHLIIISLSSLVFASTANAQPKVEEDMEQYWSTDRELPVVENKLYKKEGRFFVGLSLGLLSSEPFFWYTPLGLEFGYHFSDHVALEIGGTFMDTPAGDDDGAFVSGERNGIGLGILTHKTEITRFFEDRLQADFNATTDLQDRFLWRANAVLVWSPLYGKWAFLNRKLTHFDFNLALGGGVVMVDRPTLDRSAVEATIAPELVFGMGAAFFLSESITLRTDGRFYAYQGAETSSREGFFERLRVPAEFQLGVNFLF